MAIAAKAPAPEAASKRWRRIQADALCGSVPDSDGFDAGIGWAASQLARVGRRWQAAKLSPHEPQKNPDPALLPQSGHTRAFRETRCEAIRAINIRMTHRAPGGNP
jgi:hypothetical protein